MASRIRPRRARGVATMLPAGLAAVSAPLWHRIVGALALMLIGARIGLPGDLDAGLLLAICLVPAWWPVLSRFRGTRWLFGVGIVAVISGVWLTELARTDHSIDLRLLLSTSLLLVGTLASIAVVLWCRRMMTDARVALYFGLGLFLGIAPDSGLFSENAWKFGFGVPVTVVALAVAQMTGKRLLEVVILLALMVISAFNDARSAVAILLLTALLTAWQFRPRRATRRSSRMRIAAGLAGLAAVVYAFGQALILDGYLGEATQQRTLEQLGDSGSLILGGRPELAATAALMQHRPVGFGAGTEPSLDDILVAKEGMAGVGYHPDNGYVELYMFGNGVEVHSVAGDLWAHFGLVGLVLAGVILLLVITGLGDAIARNAAGAVFIYVSVRTLWNLFFGPINSSVPLLILAVGLALIVRSETSLSGEMPSARRLPRR